MNYFKKFVPRQNDFNKFMDTNLLLVDNIVKYEWSHYKFKEI